MNLDSLTVRYWAGAAAAAHCESETITPGTATTVGELLAHLERLHPALAPALPVCTFLCDGHTLSRDTPLRPGMVVEVLPPFAGG